jgi:hypothetical protein
LSSTRSVQTMVPTTSPLTWTWPARMSPVTLPRYPMMSVSVEVMSPLKRPFSMTVPLKL